MSPKSVAGVPKASQRGPNRVGEVPKASHRIPKASWKSQKRQRGPKSVALGPKSVAGSPESVAAEVPILLDARGSLTVIPGDKKLVFFSLVLVKQDILVDI